MTDQPFDETQRGIELRIGSSDTRLVLFKFAGSGLQPGSPFNGALACDDVDRTHRELLARGVGFVQPPQRQPWGVYAVTKDCDGNQFVLSSSR